MKFMQSRSASSRKCCVVFDMTQTERRKIMRWIVRKQSWFLHDACPRFWQELFVEFTEWDSLE